VGLLGPRAMVGGLVYYGDRRVVRLSTQERVERFVAAGGSAIVVKERELPLVEAVTPVRVVARFREGRRALLVVSPTGAEQAPSTSRLQMSDPIP
jgi:hypothetical protein